MNPTSILFVALVCFFSASQYAHCGPQQDSYKTQLNTVVLPPYNQAYKTLQNRVLNDLLTVNVAALTEGNTNLLANRLLCASRDAYEGLQQAASATNQLKTQVEQPVTASLAQIATYENDIATKESEMRGIDTTIQGVQALLAAAELIANGKKKVLEAADAAVRAAEADVNLQKAKNCRSKRGWLSSLFPSIAGSTGSVSKDTAVNPDCPINYDALESAMDRRREAASDFTNASHQVADYQKEIAYLQAHKRNLDAQVKTSKGAVAALRGDLKALQSDLSSIANINTELKKIETGLSSVFTGPATLNDVLAKLVDFEQLFTPLNAIYKSIQQYTTVDPSMHVSSAQTKQAKANLTQLESVFSKVSYNPNSDLVCSK